MVSPLGMNGADWPVAVHCAGLRVNQGQGGRLGRWSPEGFQRQGQGVLFKRHAIAELARRCDERRHTAEDAIVLLASGNPVKQPLTEPLTHLLKHAP
ncbi:MAG TPA: hypothetical protein VKG91_06500 [Roseiarcus sp.]|nr:hypothetical protein [Roseiarcus sp.]